MDAVGVAIVVDSPLGIPTEASYQRFEAKYPDQFLTFAGIDFSQRFEDDFPDSVIAKLRSDVDNMTVPGISEVIEVMMAKRKEDRYNNVEELLTDLEAVSNGQPPMRAHKRFDVSALEQLGKGDAIEAQQQTQEEESTIANYRITTVILGAAVVILLLVIAFLLIT